MINEKDLEKLNISQQDMIRETFKTVQILDIKINALMALNLASLSFAKEGLPLPYQDASELYQRHLEVSGTRKLQDLIQKYG